MTTVQMRTFVRDNLDTDSTDLPDDLLDGWLIEGAQQIENYSDTWIFRAVEYSFSTVAGTASYNLSDATGLTRKTGITNNLLRVDDVRGPNWVIEPAVHSEMRMLYPTTASNGVPRRYSTWAYKLFLWPTPSSIQTVEVNGYRESTDWLSTTPTTPDLPDEFHHLVALWGTSRAYAREGDPGMASFFENEFSSGLQRRASHYMINSFEQPLVLNEGIGASERRPYRRLFYDYE